jgi:hypothetical protein
MPSCGRRRFGGIQSWGFQMRDLTTKEVTFVSGASDWSEGSTGGDRPPNNLFANDLNCLIAGVLDLIGGTDYQATFCKK